MNGADLHGCLVAGVKTGRMGAKADLGLDVCNIFNKDFLELECFAPRYKI